MDGRSGDGRLDLYARRPRRQNGRAVITPARSPAAAIQTAPTHGLPSARRVPGRRETGTKRFDYSCRGPARDGLERHSVGRGAATPGGGPVLPELPRVDTLPEVHDHPGIHPMPIGAGHSPVPTSGTAHPRYSPRSHPSARRAAHRCHAGRTTGTGRQRSPNRPRDRPRDRSHNAHDRRTPHADHHRLTTPHRIRAAAAYGPAASAAAGTSGVRDGWSVHPPDGAGQGRLRSGTPSMAAATLAAARWPPARRT